MKRTTISISEDVRKDIFKLGKMGDTPNKIIRMVLDEYLKPKKKSKNKKIKATTQQGHTEK